MRNVTLKQFRYFDQLARHGHFGRAAEACGISQPALSVQIKDLEQELGATLFERGPRQVRLTRFGEEFATRVRDLLRQVDELGEMARASQDELIGGFASGSSPPLRHTCCRPSSVLLQLPMPGWTFTSAKRSRRN
jgi:LysR family hydrogen peroxide-inducible transcriptional activator